MQEDGRGRIEDVLVYRMGGWEDISIQDMIEVMDRTISGSAVVWTLAVDQRDPEPERRTDGREWNDGMIWMG